MQFCTNDKSLILAVFKKFLFYFLLVAFAFPASAQISIYCNNNDITSYSNGTYYSFNELPASDKAFTSVLRKLNHEDHWKSLSNKEVILQNLSQSVWIKIDIDSVHHFSQFDYLQIINPHINYLQCWIVQNDSVQFVFPTTGDHVPFSSRTISHNDFIFSINSREHLHSSVILIVDKRFSSLEIPIRLFSTPQMIEYNQTTDLFFGFIIGMGILFMLLHFLLFFYLKDFVYLWYGVFQLCLILFITIEHGYLFHYLYPNIVGLNDFIRPVSIIISIVPLFLFFNLVLELKKKFPWLYHFNIKLITGYVLLILLSQVHSVLSGPQIQLFWLKVGSISSPLLNILLLIQAIFCYRNRIKFSGFLIISILGNNLLIALFVLSQNQIIPQHFFFSNAIYFAFLLEISIMTIVMVWRYSYFRSQSEILQSKIREQQENVYKIIVDNQEKELQRVSSLLHDSVGANLGLLRLDIENMDLSEEGREKVAGKIAHIGNDIRQLSHSLSPILLQEKGLAKTVEEWINQINKNNQLLIQYEWVGSPMPFRDKMEVIAFRIVQEMIQNVMKHAKATHAFLQIVVSDSFVSIYTEDNGIGVSPEHMKKGVGIRNIEKMMDMLGGNCVIESAPGNGFNISVEFNYQFNENI